MRSRKWIALAAGALVGVAGIGLWLLLGETNVARRGATGNFRFSQC